MFNCASGAPLVADGSCPQSQRGVLLTAFLPGLLTLRTELTELNEPDCVITPTTPGVTRVPHRIPMPRLPGPGRSTSTGCRLLASQQGTG